MPKFTIFKINKTVPMFALNNGFCQNAMLCKKRLSKINQNLIQKRNLQLKQNC